MYIHSVRHPKVKKWKELFAGDDRNGEYFITNGLRMLNGAVGRGLLQEFVIHEKVREYGLFEDMDRTWISEEVAAEIGMNTGYWFAVVKKPKLELAKFGRILVLDHYHEAGALGTVIRSARSFGFDAILLTGDSANPWDSPVTRSGMDNLLELPVLSMPFTDAVRMLRDKHALFVTVGRRKAVPVEQIPAAERIAVLLSGSDAFAPSLQAVSNIICDPGLDCGDPTVLGEAAAIIMYACRNLKGE